MDFLADLGLSESLRKETIALRAAYNAFAAQELEDRSPEAYQALLDRSNEILDRVEQQLPGETASSEPLTALPLQGEDAPAVLLQDKSVVFEGQSITKTFVTPKHTFTLPSLDLQMRLGEITGIVGENGNGKTTLLRIVAGDLQVSGGNIRYPWLGSDTQDWYHIKQFISFIPQHLTPWQGFLKQNLHFAAAIRGIRGKENERLVEFVIHRLGLSQYEESLWSEISSGFKLRFELARALVRRPHLLIIDEPLANLDINTQEIFLQDLRYLANSHQHPMSILLSSQHLHEVERIADNIIFMKNGQALYNGKMQDFGKDRANNLFELNTTAEKAQVAHALSKLEGVRVEDRGGHQLIHSPTHCSGNEILRELVKANVPIGYFRDISTSTLKLFRE